MTVTRVYCVSSKTEEVYKNQCNRKTSLPPSNVYNDKKTVFVKKNTGREELYCEERTNRYRSFEDVRILEETLTIVQINLSQQVPRFLR